MNWKKAALIGALLAVVLFCAFRVYRVYSFVRQNPFVKPNVLIVSVCSLRANALSLYGAIDKNTAPHLEKFFSESQFVFQNAFNGLGWTNLINFTYTTIPADKFMFNLYDQSGSDGVSHLWRIPNRLSYQSKKPEAINDNEFEKNFKSALSEVEKNLRAPRARPFFALLHFKYLHYPLIDRFNAEAQWDRYLDESEKALLSEYLAHPERYYHKLSLLLFLANDPRHILLHPKFKNQKKWAGDPIALRKALGLMTNPDLLAEWKASEGYDRDLRILEKIYRANVHYFDEVLGQVLNLWGDKELQKNTIVAFVADHGEAHMERDELTHGMSLWDLLLHVPVAIKFPDFGPHEIVKEQIDHLALSYLFGDIVEGARTAPMFKAALQKRLPEVIIARNCNNDLRGLRYKNKYKYFVRLRDGERFLFDLENDPAELRNLASELPDEVARMETLYWQNLDAIAVVPTNACPGSLLK